MQNSEEHFQIKLHKIGLCVTNYKCVYDSIERFTVRTRFIFDLISMMPLWLLSFYRNTNIQSKLYLYGKDYLYSEAATGGVL